jgi:hypothetical protein
MSKHLAPNGKQSKLTHEQWHLVRTPQFKAWFGDWEKAYETGNYDGVSKVIDKQTKEPLVVYHGSNNMDEIEVFKSKKGFDYNFFSSDKYEPYRYVTDFERMFPNDRYNKSLRDSYYAKKIKKFFLNAKNPFDYNKITQKEKQKVLVFLQDNEQILIRRIVEFAENSGLSFSSYLREYDIEEEISNIDLLIFFLEKNSDDWWILETDVFQKYIKDNGYDAFVTKESGAYNLAIYNSKNIKLADGTNTTFDAENPDIRYKKGGKIGNEIKIDNKIIKVDYAKPEQSDEIYSFVDLSVGEPRLVLTENNKIIGAIFKEKYTDWETKEEDKNAEYKFDIVIKKSKRGKGYAKYLLDAMIYDFVYNYPNSDQIRGEVVNKKLEKYLESSKYDFSCDDGNEENIMYCYLWRKDAIKILKKLK